MLRSSDARSLLVIGTALASLAAAAVFTVDGPLARFDVGHVPGDLRRLVSLSEVFAHGTGVGMILVAVWVLDRERQRYVPRVAVLAFMPGLLANACKLLVSRHRPVAFDLNLGGAASFVGIPGHASSWELQSFPSGHAATAFGFAFALSSLYPRGRRLFVALALLASAQRVLFDAHFLSDTLAGAGIACFVAAVLQNRLLWDARSWANR